MVSKLGIVENFLDKRLEAMRKEKEKEVDEDMVTDAEKPAVDELEEFGRLLMAAYLASGELPPAALIDWAEESTELPPLSQAELDRFAISLRNRIEERLRKETGASNIGELIKQARERASLNQERAAAQLGVPMPAYQQLEAGRMPLWRAPADKFAQFCRRLELDGLLLIRWSSLLVNTGLGGVYGRLDVGAEARTKTLAELSDQADERTRQEFDQWRRQFIGAYGSASRGSAQSAQ